MKTYLQSNIRNRLNSLKCQSKISMVDKYIRRVQNLPSSMFINSEVKQYYQNLDNIQFVKEMTPLYIGSHSSINFTNFNIKKFILYNNTIKPSLKDHKNQSIHYNHKCVIKISSPNIQSKIKLLIDQKFNKSYTLKGSKGILIQQQKWNNIQIIIQVQSKGVLSTVKVQIDTMKTQFKNKSTIMLIKKDNIKKQLEQYIKTNKNRIPHILSERKRVLSSRYSSLSSRNYQSTQLQSSQSSRNLWTASSIQNRKKFIQLERSKSQVIKHLKKMSPQKQQLIRQNGNKFKQAQKNQFKKLVSLICLANFSNYVYDLKVKLYAKKIHKIKINMLCNRFIHNLKMKNKGKNTIVVKSKLAIMDLFSMFATISSQTIIKKCQQTLAVQMRPLFLYSNWIIMSKKVQKYHYSVKIVQKWWRQKRINLMAQKKIKKQLQNLDREKLNQQLNKKLSLNIDKLQQQVSECDYQEAIIKKSKNKSNYKESIEERIQKVHQI